jgi:hypothetical protein
VKGASLSASLLRNMGSLCRDSQTLYQGAAMVLVAAANIMMVMMVTVKMKMNADARLVDENAVVAVSISLASDIENFKLQIIIETAS